MCGGSFLVCGFTPNTSCALQEHRVRAGFVSPARGHDGMDFATRESTHFFHSRERAERRIGFRVSLARPKKARNEQRLPLRPAHLHDETQARRVGRYVPQRPAIDLKSLLKVPVCARIGTQINVPGGRGELSSHHSLSSRSATRAMPNATDARPGCRLQITGYRLQRREGGGSRRTAWCTRVVGGEHGPAAQKQHNSWCPCEPTQVVFYVAPSEIRTA